MFPGLSILRRKVEKNIAEHFASKLDAWCIQHGNAVLS